MVKDKKILWGVCGIGNGHTFRQLPLIEHFAKANKIVIFSYDNSHEFYINHFKDNNNVKVVEVAVPFYVGNQKGLDFDATANHPANQDIDFTSVNIKAMAQAEREIGRPDLVVSDYEPISAQYAYAHDAPFVTFDQQSKYLVGDFPEKLNGCGDRDEIERLRMFFPKADHRIACSFFDVAKLDQPIADVEIVPPTLNPAITSLKRQPDPHGRTFIIYLSSQQPFGQSLNDIIDICCSQPTCNFHVYIKGAKSETMNNCVIHDHGDGTFHDILSRCNGIISTAGHSLLSEAMYLGIPVYAIPLPLYEQQMNAWVIDKYGFGISRSQLNSDDLDYFITQNNIYSRNIKSDTAILTYSKPLDLKSKIENFILKMTP